MHKTLLALVVAAVAAGFGGTRRASADEPNDSAVQSYLSANGMLNRGLYELAAEEYRTFLSEHPGHEKEALARYGLGVSLFRMKKYDAAAEALNELRGNEDFEFAAEVGTMLGQCHLVGNRPAEAARVFEQVVERHRKHDLADDAAAGLVEALHLDGRHKEAVRSCEDFAGRWAESPLRARVEFFAGLSQMALGEYAAAAERFDALIDRGPDPALAEQASLLLAQCHERGSSIEKAVRQYRKVIDEASEAVLPDALMGLASLLERQGQYAEAGKLLDQFLERFPDNPLVESARLRRARASFGEAEYGRAFELFEQVAGEKCELSDQAAYWMGKSQLRAEEYDKAAELLAKAIDRFPKSKLQADMHYDRAIALVRAERQDDAVEALQTFREKFPEHELAPDALHLLAVIEHQRRRFDESAGCCRAFLKQYDNHRLASAVAFVFAENRFLTGRFDEAVDAYREFLSRYPEDAQADKATLRLGTALYRLERYDEAEPLLVKLAGNPRAEGLYRPAVLALGDIHFQRSEWEPAERYLSDYLSAGLDVPSADDALIKLGLCRQRQDRPEAAIEAFEQLIHQFEDSPHYIQAVFERGQALAALQRDDDASEAFETVLEKGKDSRFAPFALNHLAAIATRRNEFQRASQLFQKAAQRSGEAPMAAEALYQQGLSLMAASDFKAAQDVFDQFLERYGSHERAPQARAQRAIALARQDRCVDAVEAVDGVLSRSAEGLEAGLHSRLLYEKAWCLGSVSRPEEAAETYRELLDRPDSGDLRVQALLELSGIEINAKRFDEGSTLLRRLRKVLERSAGDVPAEITEQAVYRLGLCEFELERFDEAARLFESFVDSFPKSELIATASYYCGEACAKLGRHERAVENFKRIVEEYRDAEVYGPSLLRLGESLAALQRWERSERVLSDYLERFGDSKPWFQAQFGVGWARENQKRYDEARAAYRQVVARHKGPTAARAQFQIGECLFAQGNYEEAVRELLKVDILFAYPEWSAAALYEAGRCFEKLGKAVEARNHFARVVDDYGESRWAALASQRLSGLANGGLPGG